jgi:hypothetical protein
LADVARQLKINVIASGIRKVMETAAESVVVGTS